MTQRSARPLAAAAAPRRHTPTLAARLGVLALEDRITPALHFQFDYRYDTSGLFGNQSFRDALERSGSQLLSRIDGSLAAISPGGANTWSEVFTNPATNAETTLANPSVPADTLVVYIAGASQGGSEAGFGGPGGYSATGGASFQQAVASRGRSAYGTWGGAVSFDTRQNWYTAADASGLGADQTDFQTVAMHELTHVLGFGTSDEWDALKSGNQFTGSHARALSPTVFVSPDGEHLAQGTLSNGQPVSMQPVQTTGKRVVTSDLDYAVLADLGWGVRATAAAPISTTPIFAVPPSVPSTPARGGSTAGLTEGGQAPFSPPLTSTPMAGDLGTTAPSTPATTTPGATTPAPATSPSNLILTAGALDGTVQAYTTTAGGATAFGSRFAPFAGFSGPVRVASGDVNGDGTPDWILGTGPGGGSRVRILDGRTFSDVVPEFWAFESSFSGGVFVAAGDFDGDGRDEVVITPDQGGGARVQVRSVVGGQTQTRADFYGIDDPNFRGGARAAAGDLNGDGRDDLAVAAGFGGGPRVATFDGRTVTTATTPTHLAGDFFAFDPNLRNGVYLSIGDLNGDGAGELVIGAGPGGGPRVMALSGRTLATAGPNAALAAPVLNTFVGDPNQRGGVRVAVKDFDGDGKQDVVAGAGLGGAVTALNSKANGAVRLTLDPFGGAATDGVYVG